MSQPWFPFLYDQVFKIADILDSYLVLLDDLSNHNWNKNVELIKSKRLTKSAGGEQFHRSLYLSINQSNNQSINQACELTI